MAELKELRVTTRERLVQRVSCVQDYIDLIAHSIPEDVKKEQHGRRGLTIEDYISRATKLLEQMLDSDNDTYWDTIEYPGGENGFPYKGQNL